MKAKNSPQFNQDGSIFMGANRDPKNSKIAIYGVPYDGTTSFRPGARFGPSAIREFSNGIESFCPQLRIDLEELDYTDLGSLEIPHGAPEPVIKNVEMTTNNLILKGIKPLMLGGEHSITIGAIKAASKQYSNLIIVHLDAHADLREEWLGSIHNHACTIKRCINIIPNGKVFQVGIRSGTRSEFIEMENKKSLIPHIKGQSAKALKKALSPFKGEAIYLTVDVDWFDPSIMPGTGTPEPGGYFWDDFASIIDVIKHHEIIGADIVELAPKLDISGISSLLAAKVARSLIMLLSK